jgi:hypothetical protein
MRIVTSIGTPRQNSIYQSASCLAIKDFDKRRRAKMVPIINEMNIAEMLRRKVFHPPIIKN